MEHVRALDVLFLLAFIFGGFSRVKAEEQAAGKEGAQAEKKIPEGEPGPGKPDPVLVLWHTYDSGREDILDWSHHGSIGEFVIGERIPSNRGKALLMLGQYDKTHACGYHVMPSDDLRLQEGTVSFWLAVDPTWHSRKQGIILAAAEKGEKNNIAVVKCKEGRYEIRARFGRRAIQTHKAKLEVGNYYHFAWVFDQKKQQLWIDGKKNVEVKGGAVLNGGAGMYVGHAQDPKSGKQSSGLGAVIEDLRIYRKPLSEFPGLNASPRKHGFPPTGMLVDLEFDKPLKNGGKLLDGTGLPHKILVEDISSFNGPTCPLIHGDKGSWEFILDTAGGRESRVWIQPSSLIPTNIDEGTLEIVFKITGARPDSGMNYFLSSNDNTNTDILPSSRFSVEWWSPDVDADQYREHGFKNIPFLGISYRSSTVFTGLEYPYKFKTDEWIKFIYSWDFNFGRVWINDVRMKTLKGVPGGRVFAAGGICIGCSMDGQGFTGAVTRFRLWTYKKTFYPDEIPMKGNLPTFNLLDTKKKH